MARRLPATVVHPGGLTPSRTHWLFPVVVPDPEGLVSGLRLKGFDASRATSNITSVPAPPDLTWFTPEEANRMMEHLVFLPVYPELSDEVPDRLAGAVEEAVRSELEGCA